jgi:hypothetical protein
MTHELSAIEDRLGNLEAIGNETNEVLGRIASALEAIAKSQTPAAAPVRHLAVLGDLAAA